MRVLDCDECGETLSAEDDEALTRAVTKHYATEHEALDDDELEEKISQGAYDATDS